MPESFGVHLEQFRLAADIEDKGGYASLYLVHPHFEDGSATADLVVASSRPNGRAVCIGEVNFASHAELIEYFS